MNDTTIEQIRARIGQLEDGQRLAFGLLCCERLLPNFSRFSVQTGFGDSAVLRKAMDDLWNSLPPSSIPVLTDSRLACELQAPDSKDFETPLASAAMDAAVAVSLLFSVSDAEDAEAVMQIIQLSRDTVEMYCDTICDLRPGDSDREAKIQNHPLVIAELEQQSRDLAAVSNTRSLSSLRPEVAHGSLEL